MARSTEPLPPLRRVAVSEGIANAHKLYENVTQGAIVIGTTALSFATQKLLVNVRDFGAAGDAKQVSDGAMTNGSKTLTCSTSSPFASTDVGKWVRVTGADTAGADLFTTISGYTSSSVVTLLAQANTTVSSKVVVFGTDDAGAFQTALNALAGTGVSLQIPAGSYVIRGAGADGTPLTMPSNVTIEGNPGAVLVGLLRPTGQATQAVFVADKVDGSFSSTIYAANTPGTNTVQISTAPGGGIATLIGNIVSLRTASLS
jgi:hypothetical protein